MRLCSVLGASAALATTCAPPRPVARADRPDAGQHPPRGVRGARVAADAVGADPPADVPVATQPDAEAVDALRVEYRRILLRLASRDLAHHLGIDDAAAEISDLAAAHAGGGAGDRPGAGGRDGRRRRGWRSSRWASAAATSSTTSPTSTWSSSTSPPSWSRGRGRRRRRPAGGDPAGLPPDAGLLRPHPRGHDLAGRRQPASRGQPGSAGPHAGQPPRLLREVGQDLGVPGAAQGAPGRRRPRRSGRPTSR